MRLVAMLALLGITPLLSGCYTLAVGAAGAGGGYIAAEEADKSDGDRD